MIMSKDSNAESADAIRAIAEQRGLARALTLYPDLVVAAGERGGRPIGAFPKAFSPLTEPAGRFQAEPAE
jgi:hypothetical protein